MIKLLKYYAIFTIVYVPLALLTMPLFISWGSKRNFIEKGYVFFIGFPFDYSKSLGLILVNSLFWFVILYGIVFIVGKLVNKRTEIK